MGRTVDDFEETRTHPGGSAYHLNLSQSTSWLNSLSTQKQMPIRKSLISLMVSLTQTMLQEEPEKRPRAEDLVDMLASYHRKEGRWSSVSLFCHECSISESISEVQFTTSSRSTMERLNILRYRARIREAFKHSPHPIGVLYVGFVIYLHVAFVGWVIYALSDLRQ